MKNLKNFITEHPSVIKKLWFKTILICSMCPPNKGCNRRKKNHIESNWKEYRKTQYKNY